MGGGGGGGNPPCSALKGKNCFCNSIITFVRASPPAKKTGSHELFPFVTMVSAPNKKGLEG